MLTNQLGNQHGLAVFEVVPILAIFVLLLNFAIGFFGAIHSGIVSSISARNYAFETFRNRASLNYIRDDAASEVTFYYNKVGFRYHGIISEVKENKKWPATKRAIKFSDALDTTTTGEADVHNSKVRKVASGSRASDVIGEDEFSKIWVRTVYGICLNKSCGE